MTGTLMYHAPTVCPVCGDKLITTRKGCLQCGTEIAGEFAACDFCALPEADLQLLRVFLGSRGNLREVEKHLRVSYPTARSRLDAVLAKLGLSPGVDQDRGPEGEAVDATEAAEEYGEEIPDGPTAEEQILARVASGELSAEVAAQLLSS